MAATPMTPVATLSISVYVLKVVEIGADVHEESID